ncbi:MAG: hypothetical protein HYY95_27625 [Candidatus Rokubacteria bacterium]|nr:hypothetical protein [Candidatus Rokubacteria bacterium]MBI3109299.1 hypothetical protein [Candidatus Rokubacteria bacterium]
MLDPLRPRSNPLAAGDVIRRAAEESRRLLAAGSAARGRDVERLATQIKKLEGALGK